MNAEKFLRREEFESLLRAAKDDRERCILYLLAGVGLRVGLDRGPLVRISAVP